MGLAGAKNRRKLAKDPNNTRWSRNTDSFGHRMLRSQGWEPGQYLGPKGASHAAFHTAASASHIRVMLKDDNLGLGAKLNRGDECTGLSAFKEMLSRLNGKSEAAIETERRAKEDYMRSLYVERKFGNMRFVSGGFLVGDRIQDSSASPSDGAESSGSSSSSEEAVAVTKEETAEEEGDEAAATKKSKKSSKKRQAGDSEEASQSVKTKSKKRRREREDSSAEGEENAVSSSSASDAEADPSSTEEPKRRKRSKSEKKENKKEKKRRKNQAAISEGDDGPTAATDSDAARRQEKRERKERKKEKKRLKEAQKTADEEVEFREATATVTPSGSGTTTPVPGSGTSTPVNHVSARHMARRRFIAQKRMALTDQQAMNQIFMIKSS